LKEIEFEIAIIVYSEKFMENHKYKINISARSTKLNFESGSYVGNVLPKIRYYHSTTPVTRCTFNERCKR